MATGTLGQALRRTLLGLGGRAALSDGQLLERFVRDHDPAVFEVLVQRHGPMVLRVCQRVLTSPADADDAFQATFLVLLHRAETLARSPSVAGWLHQVAFRVALKARRGAVRRAGHEKAAAAHPSAGGSPADPAAELVCSDLRPVLDEELSRLPEKYRAPVVLCYLEGKTNDEAAEQLGWTRGAVAGKLAQARDLLRERLARRGVALSAGAVAAGLAERTAGAAVHGAALRMLFPAALAAGGAASERVMLLAKGVTDAMVWAKLRRVLVWAAVIAVLGTAAVRWAAVPAKPASASDGRTWADEFHVRWRFDNGPPPDIRRLDGQWEWREANGKSWMFAQPRVAILLPTRTPNRPFVLSIKGTGIEPRKDGRVIVKHCSFWMDDRGFCPRRVWLREGTIPGGPLWQGNFYFVGQWSAEFTGVGRQRELFRIHRFHRPYAGQTVALNLENVALEEIELKGLRAEDIPPEFRDMEKAARSLPVGPFDFPAVPIPHGGAGPARGK